MYVLVRRRDTAGSFGSSLLFVNILMIFLFFALSVSRNIIIRLFAVNVNF